MALDGDVSRTVRLKTRRLAEELERRGWSAARLHAVAGEPSRATIYRWLKDGARSPDGLVPVEWPHVCSVAKALRIPPRDLVDVAPDAWDHDREKWVRLAASLGPRVYPSLMRSLGMGMPMARVNAAGDVLESLPREHGDVIYHRFSQWSVCEAILRDQSLLLAAHARSALEWAGRMGLDVAAAPELHCLCALALENVALSLEAALAWMRRALLAGSLIEARWVGTRVLRGEDVAASEQHAEVALLLSFVCNLCGDPHGSIGMLSDLTFPGAGQLDDAVLGRAHLELARAYHKIGQMQMALSEVAKAATLLGRGPSGERRLFWFEALLEQAHLLQETGDADAARVALSAVDRVVRTTSDAAVSRFYRLLAISALDRGDVSEARGHFETAVDIAEGHGNAREVGLGQCNVALTCALMGDFEEAQVRFEQSLSLVSSGNMGPSAVAFVHRNIAEFELDQGHTDACRHLARIAMASYEKSGEHAYVSRCRALIAEALALDGQLAVALTEARAAHRHAVEAGSPLDQARALAVSALASIGEPTADSLARAAEQHLDAMPSIGQVIPRLTIARRCATVYARGPQAGRARQALAVLRDRAKQLGLVSEQARIEALLNRS